MRIPLWLEPLGSRSPSLVQAGLEQSKECPHHQLDLNGAQERFLGPGPAFLHLGKRSRLCDRDTTYTQAFDALMKARGVEPIVLPPRSSNPHAYGERYVRSIQEEALEPMVMWGERSLSDAMHPYLTHDHTERHQ
jgi:hypothetical protein